jgi:phosphoribosylamine-glycine ligase
VIKADGLAAGKGVVIAADPGRGAADRRRIPGRPVRHRRGAGGHRGVHDRRGGLAVRPLRRLDRHPLFGAAQDHKRAYDGDKGPNTGGMGTYSPPPVLTDALIDQAWRELIEPTVKGMAAEGNPYVGVLYAGLMLTPRGPKLVEYNARFGDPECQTLMLRLQSDLVPILLAAAKGELASAAPPVWREEAAICVVLAAEGYPDARRPAVSFAAPTPTMATRRWSSTPARRWTSRRPGRRRRPGAERLRSGRDPARSPRCCLCGAGHDQPERRLLPQRHRLAGAEPARLSAGIGSVTINGRAL